MFSKLFALSMLFSLVAALPVKVAQLKLLNGTVGGPHQFLLEKFKPCTVVGPYKK
jgi:hypothetical protein